MAGYVGLFRCILEKPIWKNSTPEQKTILITLLLMVNHHEAQWEWKGEKFKVMPGQKITSLEKIVEAAGKGISIQNVRSALTKLEKLEFLTNESTKTGRLITIVNWALYQVDLTKANKGTNKEVTNDQQRGNKEVTPNKKDIKVIKDKLSIIEAFTNNQNLLKALNDFMDMRKTLKPNITERGVELMLIELTKLSNNDNMRINILNQSTMNSYKGIFPLKATTKAIPIGINNIPPNPHYREDM